MRRIALCLTLSSLPLAPPAHAQDAPVAEFERPTYRFLRQDEDWSGLRGLDASTTGDFFDPAKFIPLNHKGDVWVSFGASLRLRAEGWNNFNFGAPPTADSDDVFTLTRLLFYGDLHLGSSLRLFAEGKSALAHGRDLAGGDRTIDEDPLDLQQLFVDWSPTISGEKPLTIRPGRQMLSFGRQRLVSPLPWGNTLRTWDGVSASWKRSDWTTVGFYTQFVPIDQENFNTSDAGAPFYGIYATRPATPEQIGLDLYWLGFGKDDATINGTTGDENRQSLGSRVFGKFGGGFDYDAEGTYQFGDIGASSVSAFGFATEVGHLWVEQSWKPRVWVGFDYASGDSSAGGSVGTFNQLYPLGHAFMGFIDQIGRQNIIDASFGAQAVAAGWRFGIGNHAFWAANTNDALYNAGGAPFRAGGSYQSRQVGFEIDLTATRKFGRHTDVLVGYSHFFAGDAIEESGPSDDIDFVYVSLEFGF